MNNYSKTVAGRRAPVGGLLRNWAGAIAARLRADRVAPVLSGETGRTWGVGSEWRPLSYGEYYPRSVPVYAAIRLRGESVARTPLVVHRPAPGSGVEVPAGADHPLQRLLREIQTVSQHVIVADGSFQRVGRHALGLPVRPGL